METILLGFHEATAAVSAQAASRPQCSLTRENSMVVHEKDGEKRNSVAISRCCASGPWTLDSGRSGSSLPPIADAAPANDEIGECEVAEKGMDEHFGTA